MRVYCIAIARGKCKKREIFFMKRLVVSALLVLTLNITAVAGQPLCSTTPPQRKHILLTMLYNEKNSRRRQEYLSCLERNLAHPAIEHIHVFYDTTTDDGNNILLNNLRQLPLTITLISGRVTFETLFEAATQQYNQRAIIIGNADIFFDETLSLLDDINLAHVFIALTRWEIQTDGSTKPRGASWDPITKQWKHRSGNECGSQDVWIFQAPLPPFEDGAIDLGTVWCDPYIAYQAKQAGLHVINPCLSIKSYHLHQTNIRHNQGVNKSQKPYLFLPFSTIDDLKQLSESECI
jgi:hypothetical protein